MTNTLNAKPVSFTLNHIFPADFENAEIKNLKTLNPPKGAFQLKASTNSHIARGTLTSAPIKTLFAFNELIVSAGAFLNNGNAISIEARVKTQGGKWSKWYAFGDFTADGESLSAKEQEDENGKVDIDILKLKTPCEYFKYRITVESFSRYAPIIKQVSAAYTNTKRTYNEKTSLKKSKKFRPVKLNVPMLSQMAMQFKYSKDICSPVSLAMTMNYHGIKEDPLKTVSSVYDSEKKIYGNWMFNTQYAGTKKLYAHIRRFNSLSEAETYILKGIPIIASITFGPGKLKKSPIKFTKGHIVVIKGFTKNGNIIVNDPAAAEDKTVETIYNRREFAKAWLKNKFGTAYIIEPGIPRQAIVGKPYCNIMSKPSGARNDNVSEKNFETQIIAGEKITILKLENDWAKVAAIEQMHKKTTNDDLAPYSGWIDIKCLMSENMENADIIVTNKKAKVLKSDKREVSIGTKLKFLSNGKDKTINAALGNGEVISLNKKDVVFKTAVKALKNPDIRKGVIKTAKQFLGDKYRWGGRSGFEIDCSGLVNLSYRAMGIDLPRNAADQFVFAKSISKEKIKQGDLIFSREPADNNAINHVMIYSGAKTGKLIEATRETNSIREISFKEKFGKDLSNIKNGQTVDGKQIYFKTVIKSAKTGKR